MRAYRPSHVARGMLPEEMEDLEKVRMDNVRVYLQRASAGLPLFEVVAEVAQPPVSNSRLHRRRHI